MKKLFGMTVLAASLFTFAGAIQAEQIAQPRTIDARITKVNLDGVVNLYIKQGPTASLRIIGERDEVAKVKVTRTTDTINIEADGRHWHFGSNNKREIRAELTVPNLTEIVSHGVGETEIAGFNGDALKLSLEGAGAMNVTSTYRNVVARLGGVGSMTLNSGNSDQIDVKLRGAGHIEINGNSRLLRADLGGLGALDAEKLIADAVELDMSGLGGAEVYAKYSANLKLNGMGSATVHGNPAKRTADASGMGSVSWD